MSAAHLTGSLLIISSFLVLTCEEHVESVSLKFLFYTPNVAAVPFLIRLM